jgi:hypothetical protein
VRPAAFAVLRAHENGTADQFVPVGAVLRRDLLPSLAGPYQIHVAALDAKLSFSRWPSE